ncbi:glycosyltransferase [Agrococcus sp. HG114]|uniref:glycosyltransferase n=1 Tax=Agrococcus sp. HG114 TaxID=2969757 RepID=UPI00215A4A63|nr:glycosyltransferase [Agrococcus sp. HG114]MCR8669943.1 glycosyltransferase [Agrococcus sp. HG114]
MIAAAPSYAHLAALTDGIGVFEHALLDAPRREHGYCVDDAARALRVTVLEPDQSPLLAALTETSLRFVIEGLDASGRCRNRRTADGRWSDAPSLGDWWGRAVWGLGTAAARAPLATSRRRAMRAFDRAVRQRSPHLRATAFAALGASEALLAQPDHAVAAERVRDALDRLRCSTASTWRWPEERLAYSNGSLPHALIAGGAALGDDEAVQHGIEMLDLLLAIETRDDHLSVTGTRGRGPGETAAQFDQQPIEVAAIADAAACAFDVTGDARWRDAVGLAWAWFEGRNDSGTPMVDPATGAGFDGLEPAGRNENRGAESTLAALSTAQHARRLSRAVQPA